MEKKFKLGVIGAGFMSTAIVKGVISSSLIKPEEIIVSDINQDSLSKVSKLNVCVTNDNKLLVSQAEYVLFAIKPQNLDAVLSDVKNCDCKKIISIMAGVKKSKIKNVFSSAKVARCMPNTPCSIGCGAVGLDLSDYFDDRISGEFVKNILESFAEVVLVDENKLNAVTGVSGSSPAYFYLFVKGIIDSGVKHGLSYDDAKTLAVNTMVGAGKMILNNKDKSLDELITAVCSKGGTTIEAIKIYENAGLNEITERAVDACVSRAFELENL